MLIESAFHKQSLACIALCLSAHVVPRISVDEYSRSETADLGGVTGIRLKYETFREIHFEHSKAVRQHFTRPTLFLSLDKMLIYLAVERISRATSRASSHRRCGIIVRDGLPATKTHRPMAEKRVHSRNGRQSTALTIDI